MTSSEIDYKQQTFYILIEGQRKGPFSFEQIKTKIENKELLLTDMISMDNSEFWERIHALECFDRRQESGELPSMPQTNLFNRAGDGDDPIEPHDATKEAIVKLAFIGNIKTRRKEDDTVNETSETDEDKQLHVPSQEKMKESKSGLKNILLIMIGMMAAVFIISTLLKDDSTSRKKTTQAIIKNKNRIHKLTPRPIIRKNPFKAKDRTVNKRKRNRPFRKSKSFREKYQDSPQLNDDFDEFEADEIIPKRRKKITRRDEEDNEDEEYDRDEDEEDGSYEDEDEDEDESFDEEASY